MSNFNDKRSQLERDLVGNNVEFQVKRERGGVISFRTVTGFVEGIAGNDAFILLQGNKSIAKASMVAYKVLNK